MREKQNIFNRQKLKVMLHRTLFLRFNLGRGIVVGGGKSSPAPSPSPSLSQELRAVISATLSNTAPAALGSGESSAAADAVACAAESPRPSFTREKVAPLTDLVMKKLSDIAESQRSSGSRQLSEMTLDDTLAVFDAIAHVTKNARQKRRLVSPKLLRRLESRLVDVALTATGSNQLSAALLSLHQLSAVSRPSDVAVCRISRAWLHLITTPNAPCTAPTPQDAARALFVLGALRIPYQRSPTTVQLVHRLFDTLTMPIDVVASPLPKLKPGGAASIVACAAHYRLTGAAAERVASGLLTSDHILQLSIVKCASLLRSLAGWQDPPPSARNLIEAVVFKLSATIPQSAEEKALLISSFASIVDICSSSSSSKGNPSAFNDDEKQRLIDMMAAAVRPLLVEQQHQQQQRYLAAPCLHLLAALNRRARAIITRRESFLNRSVSVASSVSSLSCSVLEDAELRAALMRGVSPLVRAKQSSGRKIERNALELALRFAVDTAHFVRDGAEDVSLMNAQLAHHAASFIVSSSSSSSLSPRAISNTVRLVAELSSRHEDAEAEGPLFPIDLQLQLAEVFISRCAGALDPADYARGSEAALHLSGASIDELSLGRLTSVLADPNFTHRLSFSNSLAVARGWVSVASQSREGAVRPDPMAVQDLYTHISFLAPKVTDISLISEALTVLREINCLTPRVFSGLTQGFRDAVCGRDEDLIADSERTTLLIQLEQSSSDSDLTTHEIIFATFEQLAVEHTTNKYKGADGFREAWTALREFVIASAFKFDARCLVAAANALAVVSSADRAVFGVLARRAVGFFAAEEGQPQPQQQPQQQRLMSSLIATQLSAAAAAALLLNSCRLSDGTASIKRQQKQRIHLLAHSPLLPALLFNLAQQRSHVWYPVDAIVALDGLVRIFVNVLDQHPQNDEVELLAAPLLPAVVVSSWHRAFENIRGALKSMVLVREDDGGGGGSGNSNRFRLDPASMIATSVDSAVILSTATAFASSTIQDAEVLQPVLLAMLREVVLPRGDADAVVDAMACTVELSARMSMTSTNHQVERVKLIAPFAVKLPRISQRITKASSIALAAHSLSSVTSSPAASSSLLEPVALRALGKAAMRLFPASPECRRD